MKTSFLLLKKIFIFFIFLLLGSSTINAQNVTVISGNVTTPPARQCATIDYDVNLLVTCTNMIHLGNSVNIVGSTITITCNFTPGIVCLPGTLYTTQTVNLGSLASGPYTIVMQGQLMGTTYSTLSTTMNVQGCCPHLPSFTQTADSICPGDSVFFTNTSTGPFTTRTWFKNNVLQGATQNYADSFNRVGNNFVKLVLDDGSCIDSSVKKVYVRPLPNIDLGNDTNLCMGKSITLKGGANRDSVRWSNNSTTQNITVNNVGLYSIKVFEKGCENRDTIAVSIIFAPEVEIGNDTILCTGDTILLEALTNNVTYKWQDNSTKYNYIVLKGGFYKVVVTAPNGCTDEDQVLILELPKPVVDIGEDSIACLGDTVFLDATDPKAASYNWQDGKNIAIYPATKTNVYWAEVTDTNGCTGVDSTSIAFINCHPGISEYAVSTLKVAPNPFHDEIQFVLDHVDGKQVVYQLYSLEGKEIQSGNISSSPKNLYRINLKELRNGIYLIKIINGENVYQQRIIKN